MHSSARVCCSLDVSGCTGTATCGDGTVSYGEECDGELQGATCDEVGLGSGALACTPACTLDVSGCTGTATCGDGTLSWGEECDGDVGGLTCDAIGLGSGTLACDPVTCTVDTSACGPSLTCGSYPSLELGVTLSGTTVGGTSALQGACTGGGGALEKLAEFTPSTSGVLTVTMTSATDQGIYVLSCGSGAELACADREVGGAAEVLSVLVAAGEPVVIVVDGYEDPAEAGPYELTLSFTVPVCGNGAVELGEDCDGAELAGEACIGLGFASGTLGCTASCAFDTGACVPAVCGNDVAELLEECDGTDLAGQTCVARGFASGTLGCAAACSIDESGCVPAVCGDAVAELDESCDGADLRDDGCATVGFESGTLTCGGGCALDTGGCTAATCGDGTVGRGEQCDGGPGSQSCESLGFSGGSHASSPVTAPSPQPSRAPTASSTRPPASKTACATWGAASSAYADCSATCQWNRAACTTGDMCGGLSWYGDGFCDVCPPYGGVPDAGDCARCGADGVCVDWFNPAIGGFTCALVTGARDPDCGTCGNGVAENFGAMGESCDGADLLLQDCTGFGFAGGTLACRPDCSPDFSGCTR